MLNALSIENFLKGIQNKNNFVDIFSFFQQQSLLVNFKAIADWSQARVEQPQ
jgi:hypothetical protein